MSFILVDGRWNGNFGIGRYSREIIQRLDLPEAGVLDGKSPSNFCEISKVRNYPSNTLFYSPGFLPINIKCRQILTLHDLIHLKNDVKKIRYQIYFNSFLLPRIKKKQILVNSVSFTSAKEISTWSGLNIDDINVINNGISLEFLLAGESVSTRKREKNLLFVGNSKKYKNFEFLLKSIPYLNDEWTINLVGSNLKVPNSLSYKRILIHNNISERALANLYLQTSVLAVTSLYEGFGMPVLEGAFLGAKIVSLHDLPSVREILGDNFALGNNCNPEKFARLIENTHEAGNPISEFSRRELSEQYSWEKSAKMIEQQLRFYDVFGD